MILIPNRSFSINRIKSRLFLFLIILILPQSAMYATNNFFRLAINQNAYIPVNSIQPFTNKAHTQTILLKTTSIVTHVISYIIIGALFIICVTVWIFFSKKLKSKNKSLLKQIKESDKLKQEIKNKDAEIQRLQEYIKAYNMENEEDGQEDELYLRLQSLIKSSKVYTNPNLSRKILADMLGTNEKYLHETIKKHLNLTFSEYITHLRLNYARELLSLPSEKNTIEAICIDSGFKSRNTFHRLFREHYGLAPDEFRRLTHL